MQPSRQAARELLVETVGMPSPSGHEQAVAQLLADRMAALGYRSRVDEIGNVIGDPAGPTLVLLGHIDTVPTLLPVIDTPERLLGRGTVDAKGPFCCMVCAGAAMAAAPCRFVVIGAVGEEADSRGAWSLQGKFDPVAVIIGEPSAANGIAIAYKGRIGGVYCQLSPPGHIAGPQGNAATGVMTFWRMLEGYLADQPAGESVFDRAEAAISRLSGDASMAELHFDIRIPAGFDIDALLRHAASHSGQGSLRILEATRAAAFSRSSPPARALIASMRAAGQTPRTKVKTGTCDMNVVSRFWHVPMVAYGPGDSRLDHAPDEHLTYAEYFAAIDILTDALGRLAAELVADRGDRHSAVNRGT